METPLHAAFASARTGGGWGYGRFGAVSLSPLVTILLILWLTGGLSLS